MLSMIKRLCCITVAVLLLCTTVSAAVILNVKSTETMTLTTGITYKYTDAEASNGSQKIHQVEFKPGENDVDIRMGLSNGDIAELQTTSGMAAYADGRDDLSVIAAINGGYFTMTNAGVPYGFLVQDGEWYTSPPGWTEDGINGYDEYMLYRIGDKFSVGRIPAFSASCSFNGKTSTINAVNRHLSPDGKTDYNKYNLVLYNNRFATSTKTAAGGLEVTIDVGDNAVRAGQKLSGTVTAVSSAGNSPLESGKVVLSATSQCASRLEGLAVGDSIEIDVRCNASKWNAIDFAFGAPWSLLENGVVSTFPAGDPNYRNVNPRTAAGVKADGTLVLLTVDGRQPGVSEGMTATNLAQMMKENGCVDAVCLDGGGSTTMVIKKPGEELEIVNKYSDANERPVANALFAVRKIMPPVPGDVNGDGNVDALDIVKMRNHILAAEYLTDDAAALADVNNDGIVGLADLLMIRDHVLKIRSL